MTSHVVWLGYDTRALEHPADEIRMTIKFLSKHGPTTECKHESQMRMEIAGMSREVCESCGKVSVGYVENHLASERADKLEAALRPSVINPEN